LTKRYALLPGINKTALKEFIKNFPPEEKLKQIIEEQRELKKKPKPALKSKSKTKSKPKRKWEESDSDEDEEVDYDEDDENEDEDNFEDTEPVETRETEKAEIKTIVEVIIPRRPLPSLNLNEL
jgi:hypothetical protein